jgi:CDP-diacylglycerol--serine O-phosphatidyltransferase
MKTENTQINKQQPTILSYLNDPANLCSLVGLACTMLAIFFSVLGNYHAAMIGMIWAVGFDWADGLIARKIEGRTSYDQTFGKQLDALIDIVNYGVAPAILLLSYGQFAPLFLPGAFVIVAASAIRLSYFNTFGLSGGVKYTGLALDNNNIALVFIFMFEPLLTESTFTLILYTACLILSALNVSQIKTPKLSSNPINVYLLVIYILIVTVIYGYQLF